MVHGQSFLSMVCEWLLMGWLVDALCVWVSTGWWSTMDLRTANHLWGVIPEVIVSASDNLTEAEEAAEQLGLTLAASSRQVSQQVGQPYWDLGSTGG